MKVSLKLSEKQGQFLRDLQTRKYQYMLYGGGIKGAKTHLGAIIFLNFAYRQPNTRYAVFRKTRKTIKRTTYKTFKKAARLYNFKFRENQSDLVWYFPNGSEIHFLGADIGKDADLNEMRGLDLTAAMIDECNEVDEQVFNVLMGRVGTVNSNNEFPLIYLTCNPSQSWVKYRFYDPWTGKKLEAPYYFMQSLPQDNPWNTKKYIESLKFMPPKEYNTYVLGDWSYAEKPNQLIRYQWIKDAVIQEIPELKMPELSMGVDVAREGNDRTIFTILKENILTDIFEYKDQKTHITGREVISVGLKNSIGSNHIGVDVVGLGAGVVDHCYGEDFKVRAINSACKPTRMAGHYIFKNLRAQMAWQMREAFENGDIMIYESGFTRQLIKELLLLEYKIENNEIRLMPKATMKKELGCSPDCFIAGTQILTPKGSVNIEELSIGDKVITPFGIRKIIATWERPRKVIMKRGLTGTPTHKIYSKAGVYTLDSLPINVKIESDSIINLLKWRILRLLNIKARNIGFKQLVDIILEIYPKRTGKGLKDYFTGKFGRTIIDKRYPKDTSFTILMEIGQIIRLKTWLWLKGMFTCVTTCWKGSRIQSIKSGAKNILKRCKSLLRSGMLQKKEESGTGKMERQYGKRKRSIKRSVLGVIVSMKHIFRLDQNFVQTVVCKRRKEEGQLKNQHANIVKKNLNTTNIATRNIVQPSVQPEKDGQKQRVYNITLEHDNVYYANGVLVFNCYDSLAMAWHIYCNKPGQIISITKNDIRKEIVTEEGEEPPVELLIETEDMMNMNF